MLPSPGFLGPQLCRPHTYTCGYDRRTGPNNGPSRLSPERMWVGSNTDEQSFDLHLLSHGHKEQIIQRNPLLLQLPRSLEMVCALTEAKEELQKLLSSCFPPPVVTSAAHEYLLILQQLTNLLDADWNDNCKTLWPFARCSAKQRQSPASAGC